jgi:hypothetical protein
MSLFRNRAFATINLATFFIYGALYVTFSYQSLVLQNVLGYTATGAGAIGLPVGVLLSVLSTKVGSMTGRIGARRFLVAGQILMALGLLWYARLPADSAAWKLAVGQPSTWIPPIDALIHVLPGVLLFGVGISLVVAPLTSTLMGSIPGRFSGLGSAINNAISRVGQPLLGAFIFIAVSGTFYASLGSQVSGLDTSSEATRQAFPPLNAPVGDTTEAETIAARNASIEAFHQASVVGAVLLAIGVVVVWVGLEETGAGAKAADRRDDVVASTGPAAG